MLVSLENHPFLKEQYSREVSDPLVVGNQKCLVSLRWYLEKVVIPGAVKMCPTGDPSF